MPFRNSHLSVSLRSLLTIPFLLQLITIVGLVGYLSYRSNQAAINQLVNRLMDNTGEEIKIHLNQYLQQPHSLL